jgi:hypothetical protein
MSIRPTFALALIFVLGACRKEDRSPSPSPSAPPSASSSQARAPTEWSDFYGIQYKAPAGTNAQSHDGVLPGPGGQGGIPRGVRPSVVLMKPAPQSFYVEILKTSEPVSLEGMQYVLAGNKVGSNFIGKATSTGWELTYDAARGGGSTSKSHILYMDSAGGHYQCTFDEGNCGDAGAAEAICRSFRPKAGK